MNPLPYWRQFSFVLGAALKLIYGILKSGNVLKNLKFYLTWSRLVNDWTAVFQFMSAVFTETLLYPTAFCDFLQNQPYRKIPR